MIVDKRLDSQRKLQEDIVMPKNRKQQESVTGKSAKKEQPDIILNDWPDWVKDKLGEDFDRMLGSRKVNWVEAEQGVATARIKIKEPK
jgi:hypothetical protein